MNSKNYDEGDTSWAVWMDAPTKPSKPTPTPADSIQAATTPAPEPEPTATIPDADGMDEDTIPHATSSLPPPASTGELEEPPTSGNVEAPAGPTIPPGNTGDRVSILPPHDNGGDGEEPSGAGDIEQIPPISDSSPEIEIVEERPLSHPPRDSQAGASSDHTGRPRTYDPLTIERIRTQCGDLKRESPERLLIKLLSYLILIYANANHHSAGEFNELTLEIRDQAAHSFKRMRWLKDKRPADELALDWAARVEVWIRAGRTGDAPKWIVPPKAASSEASQSTQPSRPKRNEEDLPPKWTANSIEGQLHAADCAEELRGRARWIIGHLKGDRRYKPAEREELMTRCRELFEKLARNKFNVVATEASRDSVQLLTTAAMAPTARFTPRGTIPPTKASASKPPEPSSPVAVEATPSEPSSQEEPPLSAEEKKARFQKQAQFNAEEHERNRKRAEEERREGKAKRALERRLREAERASRKAPPPPPSNKDKKRGGKANRANGQSGKAAAQPN